MKVFALVNNRPIIIRGCPNSGWRPANSCDEGAKSLPFNFKITDDGSRCFLLVYASTDGVYKAGSCHRALEDSYAAAAEQFGILRSEWTQSRPL
jgi:hypothetical protein